MNTWYWSLTMVCNTWYFCEPHFFIFCWCGYFQAVFGELQTEMPFQLFRFDNISQHLPQYTGQSVSNVFGDSFISHLSQWDHVSKFCLLKVISKCSPFKILAQIHNLHVVLYLAQEKHVKVGYISLLF